MEHIDIPNDSIFSRFYRIKEIPDIDSYFDRRTFERNEKTLTKFFVRIVKRYKELLPPNIPLIFVIEDTYCIDEISLELMRAIKNSDIRGMCLITTYQDQFNNIIRNNTDLFHKVAELVNADRLHLMDNITDIKTAHDILLFNIKDKINVSSISSKLIDIIIRKSFNGNPLFMIDIINSLIDSGIFVKYPHRELIPSEELVEMVEYNDWSKFTVPIRMEKIIGNMIDTLPPKEIILLKYASVIGNTFDLDKLYDLNPFNSVTFDDLMSIIQNLESYGVIEILYDLNPKLLVCKFSVPFIREILYQRMLIEQKNDIHEALARKLQYSKFSYMPHHMEVRFLRNHLKTAEKSIMHHMDENEDDLTEQKISQNSLKICCVKNICERLKVFDLRLDSNIDLQKPLIWTGFIWKKSDKGIRWEKRYVVITNKKFYYWYYESDYKENKMPLGYFELKRMHSVEIQTGELYRGVEIFCIQASSWMKKEVSKGARKFIFSGETGEEVSGIITTLNFLKVKALYDEFTHNFGVINLPLDHGVGKKTNKKIKMKFGKANALKLNTNKNSNLYNSIARKSLMTLKSISSEKDNIHRISMRRTSGIPLNYIDFEADDNDNKDRIEKTKETLLNCLGWSFPVFLAFIQDIILNVDNVGMNDDNRMITVPSHLNLPMTKRQTIINSNIISAAHKGSIMMNFIEEQNSEGDSYEISRLGLTETRKTENGFKPGVNGGNLLGSDEVNKFTLSKSKGTNKELLSVTPESLKDTVVTPGTGKDVFYSSLNTKLINLDITLDDDYMNDEPQENAEVSYNYNSTIFKQNK
jgi:hypothetical protein